MTGAEVSAIRKALGLSAWRFAGLLCVHYVTVFRWEAFGRRHIKAEGMNREVLGWLDELAAAPGAEKVGASLADLAEENPLRAMLHLTAFVQSLRFGGFLPEEVSVNTRGKMTAKVQGPAEVLG